MKIFGKALKKPFLQKHASLSLSVNAIVVLILAIAMLGLGLGFTKIMFSKLKGAIEIPEPTNPATEDEPLVFNRELIEGKVGKSIIFSVNVYNSDTSPAKKVTVGITGCSGGAIKGKVPQSASQTIAGRSSVTFKLLVPVKNIKEGSAVCTVAAEVNDEIVSRQVSFNIAP